MTDESEKYIHCPVCLSEDIDDISPTKYEGIIAPSAVKLVDIRACKQCGVVFIPTDRNKTRVLRMH